MRRPWRAHASTIGLTVLAVLTAGTAAVALVAGNPGEGHSADDIPAIVTDRTAPLAESAGGDGSQSSLRSDSRNPADTSLDDSRTTTGTTNGGQTNGSQGAHTQTGGDTGSGDDGSGEPQGESNQHREVVTPPVRDTDEDADEHPGPGPDTGPGPNPDSGPSDEAGPGSDSDVEPQQNRESYGDGSSGAEQPNPYATGR